MKDTPKIFMVRGGRVGEYEELCLEHNIAATGFNEVDSLAGAKDQADVLELVREAYPDHGPAKLSNEAGE